MLTATLKKLVLLLVEACKALLICADLCCLQPTDTSEGRQEENTVEKAQVLKLEDRYFNKLRMPILHLVCWFYQITNLPTYSSYLPTYLLTYLATYLPSNLAT